MTVLLEIREKIKLIYSKYEIFILPVVKFLLGFVVLNTLNGKMGYMNQLDNVAIVLIVALACSFLPTGFIIAFGALFSLAHMYALSLEVLLVGFCVYLVLYLLFFRFSPKDSLVVILTPLLFAMKIPYVIPVTVGLLCGPASMVSVGSGIVVHYLLQTVSDNASTINTMGDAETTAKIRIMIDGVVGNKSMLVMIAAFCITVMVVYLIRRMPIDYAWTIAMIAGAMTNIVILLVGDLIYDTNMSVPSALLGSLLAVAAGKIAEFFRFCVDYSRTEKVQFEDDEYYYYVKAVPKMTVAMSTRTVKKINDTRQRSVVTERTPAGRGYGAAGQGYGAPGRVSGRSGGRSVTVGSTAANRETGGTDDYEEI